MIEQLNERVDCIWLL